MSGHFVRALALGAFFVSTSSFAAVTLSIDETQVPIGSSVLLTVRAASSDSASVVGMRLNPQIDDGGSAGGGSDTPPVFSALPQITGTLFQGGDVTPISGESYTDFPKWPAFSFDTGSAFVPNGVVAYLVLDTTGLSVDDTFTVDLSDPSYVSYFSPSTAGPNIQVNTTPSTITVAVPEPSTLAFMAALGGLTLLRRPRACNC